MSKTGQSLNLITIPARGLSVGGDLQYADEATLGRAIQGRQGI